jgi:nucleoside-diphosphate-sugar epimerase
LKRVVLTGATGFIGRHCLTALVDAGYDVHAVSSKIQIARPKGVCWHQANLLDERSAASLIRNIQPSHMLHLAWYVQPGKALYSAENLRWVQASLALLREFAERDGKRAVLCGSGYEYAWNNGCCSETETPTLPNTFYGVCKNALRELTTAYADLMDVSTAWARIFFLYGPHEHPDRLVSSIIRSLLDGLPARCTHGNQVRDYLHVHDVADALVKLLGSPVRGPINIGSGQPTTLREVATTIGNVLGRPELIELGAVPARENENAVVVADVRRLADELGWQPRFGLRDGLNLTAGWWKQQMENPLDGVALAPPLFRGPAAGA